MWVQDEDNVNIAWNFVKYFSYALLIASFERFALQVAKEEKDLIACLTIPQMDEHQLTSLENLCHVISLRKVQLPIHKS